MKNLAIFASGTGSNALKIIEKAHGSSAYKVGLIISNKNKAGVLSIAANNNIPSVVIDRESFYKTENILKLFNQYSVDMIVLAGFLWLIPKYLVQAFPNKIINIHPALLPKYGGKGMYGNHVHQAVKANNEPETGITIHYVNEAYDEGNIIFQATCTLTDLDDIDAIRKKVQQLEHQHFPQVIEDILLNNKT